MANGATGPVPETGQDAVELAELLDLEPAPAGRTLRYGEHPSQVVDCFGDGPPRVVVLHGGFWRQRQDRGYLTPFAAALAEHGMATALVEYRRVGPGPRGVGSQAASAAGTDGAADTDCGTGATGAVGRGDEEGAGHGGGGWRETSADVRAALEALAADPGDGTRAEERGEGRENGAGGEVPPPTAAVGPPVLLGHSAGGQLALWAASRLPELVRHTVAFAPVADLGEAGARGVGGGAVESFLGPRWSALLDEADPLRLPAPEGGVTLLHGTADGQVPLELSLNYAERLPGHLLRLPGVGHYGPLVPGTVPFTTLALILRNLLAAPG